MKKGVSKYTLPFFVLEVSEDLVNDVVNQVIIARVVRQLNKQHNTYNTANMLPYSYPMSQFAWKN